MLNIKWNDICLSDHKYYKIVIIINNERLDYYSTMKYDIIDLI